MDSSQRREFSRDLHRDLNRSSGGFELAFVAAIFGGLGLLVDRWLGTTPIFGLALFLIGIAGTVVKLWIGYDQQMRKLEGGGSVGSPFVTRLEGPAPEAQVARDMIRRALPVAPVLIGICAAMWSVDGAISSAYAIAIVLANFALSAALLAYTARISLALLMGAALFGFLLRLGLIFLAVLLVRDASWMHLGALGATLVVTHLGLLFWELRYVSLSLAHPGLKPSPKRTRSFQPAPKESVAP